MLGKKPRTYPVKKQKAEKKQEEEFEEEVIEEQKEGEDDFEYAAKSLGIFWKNANTHLRKRIVDEKDLTTKLNAAQKLPLILKSKQDLEALSKTTEKRPEEPKKSFDLREEMRKK